MSFWKNVNNINFVCVKVWSHWEGVHILYAEDLESSSQQVLCSCTLVPASDKQMFLKCLKAVKVAWSGCIPEMQWKYVQLVEILKTSCDSDQKRLALRLYVSLASEINPKKCAPLNQNCFLFLLGKRIAVFTFVWRSINQLYSGHSPEMLHIGIHAFSKTIILRWFFQKQNKLLHPTNRLNAFGIKDWCLLRTSRIRWQVVQGWNVLKSRIINTSRDDTIDTIERFGNSMTMFQPFLRHESFPSSPKVFQNSGLHITGWWPGMTDIASISLKGAIQNG